MKLLKPLLLTILAVSLGFVLVVQAQIDPDTQTLIRQQPTHEAEMEQLQAQYKSYLSVYRNTSGQYEISVAQYFQLETLASLEKAIQDIRQVMVARNQVLDTYVKILRLELTDTHGPTLSDKQQAITDLEAIEVKIADYQLKVEASIDRPGIESRIAEFETLGLEIQSASYQALSLISFGRLQTNYDQTQSFMSVVEEKIGERNSGNLLAEKKRAKEEILTKLGQIKQELEKSYQKVHPQSESFSQGNYNSLLSELESIYVQLVQVDNYLEEVLR